ncbi:hypothetical protein [Flammeovirga sp. EKP202]|uniref:hypothetical protein n=1 Tax=Flammeovirga sp. EKP202 TaxID=2770592 RepID=UPI00165FD9F1|nr:hypothetical protein [Flammeovirga sp. EKP202]MBD0404613.1 hypothetical protein [Flammeovirga sp. EKP202]
MMTLSKKLRNLFLLPIVNLIMIGCEQPIDPVIDDVQNTKSILNQYQWYLNNFEIITKSDDIAPPILWSAQTDLLKQGNYDLEDMVYNSDDMRSTIHEFTVDRDITTTNAELDFLTDSIGRYFIINSNKIRITNSAINLNYEYKYDENLQHFTLHVNEEIASSVIQSANDKLLKYAANGTPEKIAGLITTLLYHNETIQRIINDAIVGWIAGKGEFIEHLPPEETADKIADELFNYLESLGLEEKLSEAIQKELDKITDIDADEVTQKISNEIVRLVHNSLSKEKIYDLIYPEIDQIVAAPEESSEKITGVIMTLIGSILSEDNINAISTKIWTEFTTLDQETINDVSDKITSLLEEQWINENSFYSLLFPLVEKIEDTSILKMGDLAKEATGKIEDIITLINTTFDGIEITPDYDAMESTLKTAFIAAKPVISLNGGAEKTTQEVSALIINQFLNHDFIQNTIASGITSLQEIDHEKAVPVINSLISKIGEIASPVVHDFIASKLLLIIEDTDAEYLSFQIAKAVNGAITGIISEENVYQFLYPVVDGFANLNTKLISDNIANMIFELDLIKDNINHEKVSGLIQGVLVEIQETGVENIVQALITQIAQGDLFKEVITEDRVSLIISLYLYNSAYKDMKVANNFTSATITLEHK